MLHKEKNKCNFLTSDILKKLNEDRKKEVRVYTSGVCKYIQVGTIQSELSRHMLALSCYPPPPPTPGDKLYFLTQSPHIRRVLALPPPPYILFYSILFYLLGLAWLAKAACTNNCYTERKETKRML